MIAKTREDHIRSNICALEKGKREIEKMFDGLDIGDIVFLEEYNPDYHELLRKQKARLDMVVRLKKKTT